MLLHNSSMFQIFFGDQRNSCVSKDYFNSSSLLTQKPFSTIAEELNVQQMVFLRQVHGTDGMIIAPQADLQHVVPFAQKGDYMITNVPRVGLGVVTADCVPLILYDKVHHVVAMVHAGWRGLVNGIIEVVVERMNQEYKTDASQLKVFMGPCAKACCYTVGDEVISALDVISDKDRVLCSTQGGVHFDMPFFVQLQLRQLGVPREAFQLSYNECTVCGDMLCSFRRDGTQDRNVTVVVLK